MGKIKFGTDGFRGIIADDFTFENIDLIAQAFANYLHKQNKKDARIKVAVGYDRRFLSEEAAQHISEILSRHEIFVCLSNNAVPTPAVSAFIRKYNLTGGMIVTASHNPPYFNGLKIKNNQGASASIQVTNKIERLICQPEKRSTPYKNASINKVEMLTCYLKRLKDYLNFALFKKNKFKIIVDVMHGSGAGIFEKILKGTPIIIKSLNIERDPLFGGKNPEPIAINLNELKSQIKQGDYDLGIALDGDADRIAAMRPDGRYITSHQIICLLLLHFIKNKKWSGRVVKTVNTTSLVDKIAKFYQLPLTEVCVGFKNIAAEMVKGNVILGGEESGGIGFKNYMPERDGTLAGLLLLELMASSKKTIIEIIKDMEKQFGHFVYLRRDLILPKTKTFALNLHLNKILNKKVVQTKTYDGIKYILEDESWLLIRASGTEPIVRIYAESHSLKQTTKLINFGANLVWKKH